MMIFFLLISLYELSRWGEGISYAIHYRNGKAYIGTGTCVKVYDVKNPLSPSLLASKNFSYKIKAITSGDYVFIGSEYKVYVTDSNLNVLSTIELSYPLWCLYYSPPYLYIGGKYLSKWDLHDVNSPSLVKSIDAGTEIYDIKVQTLYGLPEKEKKILCATFDGLKIFDGDLNLLSSLSLPYGISLWTEGSVIYFLTLAGLFTVDPSGGDAPTIVSLLSLPGVSYKLVKKENYIFVTNSEGIKVIDVSNPQNLNLLSQTNLQGFAIDTAGYNLITSYSDFSIINACKPESLYLIHTEKLQGYAKDLEKDSSYIYFLTQNFFNILDTALNLISSAPVNFNANAFTVHDTFAFIVGDSLKILNISSIPPHSIYCGNLEKEGLFAKIKDTLLFICDGNIEIYNVKDPQNPLKVSEITTPGKAKYLALKGDTIFICDDIIRVYDISEISLPTQIAQYEIYNPIEVKISDSILAVSNGDFYLLNISNLSSITPIAEYNFDNASYFDFIVPSDYTDRCFAIIRGNLIYLNVGFDEDAHKPPSPPVDLLLIPHYQICFWYLEIYSAEYDCGIAKYKTKAFQIQEKRQNYHYPKTYLITDAKDFKKFDKIYDITGRIVKDIKKSGIYIGEKAGFKFKIIFIR